MKRAYATRALRWHPDRQDDPSPAALARAELHMAELNAAWEVLRNPASRAAYDTSLRAEREASAPGRRAPLDDDVRAAVLVPDVGPRRPPPRHRVVPAGCLWTIGLLAAGLATVVALIALGDDGGPPIDVRTREQLGRGACVVVDQQATVATVVEVPCGEAHDAVVVERVDFPQPCPNGTTAILLEDGRSVVCLRPDGGP